MYGTGSRPGMPNRTFTFRQTAANTVNVVNTIRAETEKARKIPRRVKDPVPAPPPSRQPVRFALEVGEGIEGLQRR